MLVSATAWPCEIAASSDGRDLGVYIAGLTIDDGFARPRALDLADPLLCIGFHGLEDGARRWAAARAHLPAELWAEQVMSEKHALVNRQEIAAVHAGHPLGPPQH